MSSLKTKDPIIVSVGWRRYETIPIYTQDCGGWHKMLEYTPAAEFCMATFWGPLVPSGSGVVAVRSLADNKARLEQHSWQMSSLKTKDPIIVSVGWRRYETIPIYTQDCGGWHKMLEYTPAAEFCMATFWGPLVPSGSGVVAVRSLADNKAAFRILARAVVLDYHDVEIRKQIMRTGDLHWKQIQVKVPRIFNLPTAVLERRDGVWQSMDSVEKAHVLVMYKNKIAPEPMRTRLIELLGEKLKDDPAKARGNPEQRRAVLTFQTIPPTWGSKLREECLRERMKRFYKKKKDESSVHDFNCVTETAGEERDRELLFHGYVSGFP